MSCKITFDAIDCVVCAIHVQVSWLTLVCNGCFLLKLICYGPR